VEEAVAEGHGVSKAGGEGKKWFPGKVSGEPPMKGKKRLPSGKSGVLGGLAFVMTGILDSLEREEAKGLIEKYGGRVVTAMSGKVRPSFIFEALQGANLTLTLIWKVHYLIQGLDEDLTGLMTGSKYDKAVKLMEEKKVKEAEKKKATLTL